MGVSHGSCCDLLLLRGCKVAARTAVVEEHALDRERFFRVRLAALRPCPLRLLLVHLLRERLLERTRELQVRSLLLGSQELTRTHRVVRWLYHALFLLRLQHACQVQVLLFLTRHVHMLLRPLQSFGESGVFYIMRKRSPSRFLLCLQPPSQLQVLRFLSELVKQSIIVSRLMEEVGEALYGRCTRGRRV